MEKHGLYTSFDRKVRLEQILLTAFDGSGWIVNCHRQKLYCFGLSAMYRRLANGQAWFRGVLVCQALYPTMFC